MGPHGHYNLGIGAMLVFQLPLRSTFLVQKWTWQAHNERGLKGLLEGGQREAARGRKSRFSEIVGDRLPSIP